MNWFNGSITEAIVRSKTEGAIFVVYIEGKDEKSAHLTKLIDSEEVAGKLGSDSFVAIKLEAGALPHQQFCEIYKETPIPSIYFIGKQGAPLDIVKDSEDGRSLNESIDGVLRKAGLNVEKSTAKQSENLIESEKRVPENMVCEHGVCTIKEDLPANQPSTSTDDDKQEDKEENQPEVTIEEKVEKAKQLVEKKREEKRKQEEEEDRLKEIERRKVGKDVTELKRWQNEQELKQLLEEREREKRETQAARDRVLAQIAQDKAERAAKFSNTPSTQQTVSSPQPSTSQSSSSSSPKPINTNIVRLQFRIPDGKSVTQDFKIDDTLADVHTFIDINIKLPFNKYVLSTTFPRREYTNEERQRSLLELELAPSAVLLILPIGGGGGAGSGGGGTISPIRYIGLNGLFWSIIAPFFNIFSYLKGLIFGGNSGNPTESNKRTADTPADSDRFQQKRRAGESTVIRRQGNVHRLSSRNDSDDENNTWNGNSTQQM